MRIAIDARSLSWEKGRYSGVSTYLYETMVALAAYHPEHEYFVLAPRPFETADSFPENWHFLVEGKISQRGKIWALLELPQILKKEQFDIFWGPNFTLPRIGSRCKTAFFVTIHDLALWRFPEVGEEKNLFRLRMGVGAATRKAKAVLADSVSTKKDIEELLHVPENKIKVVYPGGVKEGSKPTEHTLPVYVRDVPYFLFVSTIEPRKNIETILAAYEVFRRNTGEMVKLVLAGKRGWNCEKIYQAVDNSPFKEDIHMPGYISAGEKSALYQHAKGVLYPSLYEGFGIPVLEAFFYGAPVITARNSSLPEVGGDAAIYIEQAEDINGLAEKLIALYFFKEEERLALQEKMRQQLSRFSWKNTADCLMRLWEDKEKHD